MTVLGTLTLHDVTLLREYAAEHGKDWKDRLLEDWYTARLTGTLHALRNDPRWSHAGLAEFDPREPIILRTVPPYELTVWEDGHLKNPPGVLKWGGPHELAQIGQTVKINFNGYGKATVIAYFIEQDWLGLKVKLHEGAMPEWHRKQNKANPFVFIFGTEFDQVAAE